MILSKWPIVETNFRQFSMNGFKHEIWYGDALAGSGIGMAKVKIGQDLDAFWVNVFVSHYHAEYDRYFVVDIQIHIHIFLEIILSIYPFHKQFF